MLWMAFTIDCTEQCGQPADLAQLEERHDQKGSVTYIGSSPVIGIGKGLRFRLCQNNPSHYLWILFLGALA